jgi:hypothetical protein
MGGRDIIEQAINEPTALAALQSAYDHAWSEISSNFVGEAEQQKARMRLARAFVLLREQEPHDPDSVKEAALQLLAMTYRHQWPFTWHAG